jgi:DNA-binding GntR family transcriptional regulator
MAVLRERRLIRTVHGRGTFVAGSSAFRHTHIMTLM